MSTQLEPDGFVKRTDDLLFAVFRSSEAYLVDIMPYDSFYEDHLLRVLLHELPDARVLHELKGVIGMSRQLTKENRRTLRRGGVNTAHEIDGRFYATLGMITAAGTSVASVEWADQIIKELEAFGKVWKEREQDLRQVYLKSGVELPIEPQFQFHMHEDGWPLIWEAHTKSAWAL